MASPKYMTSGLMWRFSNAMTTDLRVVVQGVIWHGATAVASNSLYDGFGNVIFKGIGTTDKLAFSRPRAFNGLSVPTLTAGQYFDVYIV